jgi:hypothetical protein
MNVAATRAKDGTGSLTPPNRAVPQNGDLVVARESRAVVVYTLCQVPGVVQVSTAARDEAIRLARGFAQAHGLDVWYAEDGGYRLLEVYRKSTARIR